MEEIKFALIGCGRISPNHIACAKEFGEIKIQALCDINKEITLDLIKKFDLKDVKIYTDYKEMIEKEDLVLISIATDSKTHAEIALNCIEKSINLIIEKPIALSTTDAKKIIELAKLKKVIVCSCHQNRFNKAIVKLKKSIDNRELGKLFHITANIRWNRGEEYYKQASWRGKWESDGGALMNQCIHNIDLLKWLTNEKILEVFAYTDNLSHPYIEAEDIGLALVKFTGNVYGVIEGTTNVYPKNLEETLSVFGEKGTVKIGGKSINKVEAFMVKGYEDDEDKIKAEFTEEPKNIYGFGHRHLYKDVIQAIMNNTEPLVTAQDGMEAVELVLAIYKSAHTGKAVKLPLGDCSTTEFIGKFNK